MSDRAYRAVFLRVHPTGKMVLSLTTEADGNEREYAELVAAGATTMHAPHDAFWGARYAIVTDPDGNHVGFMSPSDDAFRSRPPDPPDFVSSIST